MIKVFCDRCGAEVPPGKLRFLIDINRQESDGYISSSETIYLCKNCHKKLDEFIFLKENK